MMSGSKAFRAACFCGAVEIDVQGPPLAVGICHCASCRRWHNAPINLWAVWPDACVQVVGGRDRLIEFNKQGAGGPSGRSFCAQCGGAVLNRKPTYGMVVVYAMGLEGSGLELVPTFHSFYDEGILHIADGLPKFVDLPERFGGSGRRLDEPAASGMRT